MAYSSTPPSRPSRMGTEGESSISSMPESPMSTMGMPSRRSSGGGSMMKGLVTAIIVILILAAGIAATMKFSGFKGFGGLMLKSEWQAVFLSNGQVYFGKVTKMTPEFLVLSNIYYMQVVTRQNTIGQPPDVQTQPEQQLTLIKLGNEIHGPRDEMFINRDQIVLIEDLKDDGRVVTAIKRYISGDQTPPAPQPEKPAKNQ